MSSPRRHDPEAHVPDSIHPATPARRRRQLAVLLLRDRGPGSSRLITDRLET